MINEIIIQSLVSGPSALGDSTTQLYVVADLLLAGVGLTVRNAVIQWDTQTHVSVVRLPESCDFVNPFMRQAFSAFALQGVLAWILQNPKQVEAPKKPEPSTSSERLTVQ